MAFWAALIPLLAKLFGGGAAAAGAAGAAGTGAAGAAGAGAAGSGMLGALGGGAAQAAPAVASGMAQVAPQAAATQNLGLGGSFLDLAGRGIPGDARGVSIAAQPSSLAAPAADQAPGIFSKIMLGDRANQLNPAQRSDAMIEGSLSGLLSGQGIPGAFLGSRQAGQAAVAGQFGKGSPAARAAQKAFMGHLQKRLKDPKTPEKERERIHFMLANPGQYPSGGRTLTSAQIASGRGKQELRRRFLGMDKMGISRLRRHDPQGMRGLLTPLIDESEADFQSWMGQYRGHLATLGIDESYRTVPKPKKSEPSGPGFFDGLGEKAGGAWDSVTDWWEGGPSPEEEERLRRLNERYQ